MIPARKGARINHIRWQIKSVKVLRAWNDTRNPRSTSNYYFSRQLAEFPHVIVVNASHKFRNCDNYLVVNRNVRTAKTQIEWQQKKSCNEICNFAIRCLNGWHRTSSMTL